MYFFPQDEIVFVVKFIIYLINVYKLLNIYKGELMKRIETVLESEHREAEDKLQKIIESSDPNERSKTFSEVSKEILQHIEAEEEIYYKKIRKDLDVKAELDESKQEHHVAKGLIREIESTNIESPEWIAKVKVLKENLEHHHEEEEEDFFKDSRKSIKDSKAKDMSENFMQVKKSV